MDLLSGQQLASLTFFGVGATCLSLEPLISDPTVASLGSTKRGPFL